MASSFRSFLPLLVVASSTFLGCAAESSVDVQEGDWKWNAPNDPLRIEPFWKTSVGALPLEGRFAGKAIAGDYWATYEDSINARWDGESPAPSEKYAAAFDKPGLADVISAEYGIDGMSYRSCIEETDCDQYEDGSTCSRREGVSDEEAGSCIPTWWGICHGWAPFAISEPAPLKAVERNGVTFYPGDLTALMSLVYADAPMKTKFLSQRCNSDDISGLGDMANSLEIDECQDMNAGAFHVLLANRIGAESKGFVFDRTIGDEVWNQPVVGYRVSNAVKTGASGKGLASITRRAAIELLEPGSTTDPNTGKLKASLNAGNGRVKRTAYRWNVDAAKFYYVEVDVDWITEAGPTRSSAADLEEGHTRTTEYRYILEADSTGKIMGGEWVGDSREAHPDFSWWTTSTPTGASVARGMVTYANVKSLLDEAAAN